MNETPQAKHSSHHPITHLVRKKSKLHLIAKGKIMTENRNGKFPMMHKWKQIDGFYYLSTKKNNLKKSMFLTPSALQFRNILLS